MTKGSFMTGPRAAVVLGASGSVGSALITALVRDGTFSPIVTLVRRSQPAHRAMADAAGVELRETLVPTMDAVDLERTTREVSQSLDGDVVGFSVLGIGAGTAKLTIEQHRAIDVHLNGAFARGLHTSGRVQHLAFLSAVGADPTAAVSGSGAAGMPRYVRVKGESEEAVKASGLPLVSVFRPSVIIGSEHTPWLLAKVMPVFSFLTPQRFRAITVDQIARAMIASGRAPSPTTAVYHHAEMMALIR